MICLCLTGETLDEWYESIERNRRSITMVEMRIDLLRPEERSVEMIADWWQDASGGLDAIVTIRRSIDYGSWDGGEDQRLFLFLQIVQAIEPRYIDVEIDYLDDPTWGRLTARQALHGGHVVRSYHGEIPGDRDLNALAARLARQEGEVPKLAVAPRDLYDVALLLETASTFRARAPGRSAVWIAMGEIGTVTRALPGLIGSAWTYASDSSAPSAAPGQLDPATLAERFRVDSARAGWAVCAVIGSPIVHSRSPEYHNARLREEGFEAVYVPIRVDEFGEFEVIAGALPLVGVSVTVPHKEAAARIATVEAGSSERVRAVGAANTLVRGGGGWYAENTDVEGFLEPLLDAVGEDARSSGGSPRRAAIIGAGGAARAAAVGLRELGWSIAIFNRTPSRATRIAEELGFGREAAHPMEALSAAAAGAFDLIVQTTPVGMQHGPPGDPAAAYRFSGSEIAYDLIYVPAETEFLRRARDAGCTTLNGERMFRAQAEAQFALFREALTQGSAQ